MTCLVCHKWAQQLHHVIYRQELRRIARTSDLTFAGLISDERGQIPLCLACHGRHHNRQAPIPMALLPDDVIDFAVEVLGPTRAYNYCVRNYFEAALDARIAGLIEVEGSAEAGGAILAEGGS